MILDRWLEQGKLLKDPLNPLHHAWVSKIGETNVALGEDSFAPYVVDQIEKIVRFADCELRLTASDLEFWREGKRQNTLSFHPEVKILTWSRKTVSVSSLTWTEEDDRVSVSYKVSTEDAEVTIIIKIGRTHKARFSIDIKALKAGKQRILVEFAEKGTQPIVKDKEGKDVLAPWIEFEKTEWAWAFKEHADHKVEPDPLVTKISLKEKIYAEGEISKLSPDTWGPTGIVTNNDDGGELGGSWYVNGTDAPNKMFFIAESTVGTERFGLSWTLPAIGAGATINKMYVRGYQDEASGTVSYVIRTEDSDPATAVIWASGHLPSGASWINADMATQSLAFNNATWYFGESDTQPHNLNGDLTDLMTSYGAISSGDRINIAGLSIGAGNDYAGFDDYQASGSSQFQLSLDWIEGSQTHQLAGSADSISLLSGVVGLTKRLIGSADSISLLSGMMGVTNTLAASSNSVSLLSGIPHLVQRAAGTANSVSLLSGVVKVKRSIAALASSVSLSSGTLDVERQVGGLANSVSLLSGTLTTSGGGGSSIPLATSGPGMDGAPGFLFQHDSGAA